MDQALKQRLVGATVLIILGVILLPMLLSGQPELQNGTRRIELPDKPPELSMDKRRFPIGQHSPDLPSTVPEPAPIDVGSAEGDDREEAVIGLESEPLEAEENLDQQEPDVTESMVSAPVESVTQEATAPTTNAVEVESPQPEPLPGNSQGRYLVQVASFSNPTAVNKVSEELNRLGLPVLLDNVSTEAGQLHRVRVGPFDDTGQAEAAIERIHGLNLDLQPRLLDLRPDENAPVTDPADPLVRWVVQTGVFSGRDNAERMVGELRSNGFSAFSERVTTGGKTIFIVRVGPVTDRRRAEELHAELERKMEIDGMVMSVD